MVSKIFTGLLSKNNIRSYSRYTSKGAVFAERFRRTNEDYSKKHVFLKRDGYWIDELPVITKQ